jgi:hypothetical protein
MKRRHVMGVALCWMSCVHTPVPPAAEDEITTGVKAATNWRKRRVGPTVTGSPTLEQAYCPMPRTALTVDKMLDCAEYEEATGDVRNAVDLWVKVATVGETQNQRCLALDRLELRTDGRALGLVPLATMNECHALFAATADACSVTCNQQLAECRQRQQQVANDAAALNAIAGSEWGSIVGVFLSEEALRKSSELPRCGEEFKFCYRSCTIVR